MPDSLADLTALIQKGLGGGPAREILEGLFGSRYQQRHFAGKSMIRDAFMDRGGDERIDGISYAGLIHPDNALSGLYGGCSLVWFPTQECGSILTFVVGTRGLSPDEGILTRPGHRRRIAALRRYLARLGITAWSKPDPASIGQPLPQSVQERFPGFEAPLGKYGPWLYCIARVPDEAEKAAKVVQAFFDLYGYERGWQAKAEAKGEFEDFLATLRADLFANVTAKQLWDLVLQRRFVVLQGPPGTGKTRLAEEIRRDYFGGHGMTIQFHPAVTYEDFIVGLSPDSTNETLRFDVRPGWLLEAASQAKERPFLLVIDEINRADLGRILGEAIYLFEAGDVGTSEPRTVRLAHSVHGEQRFALPENLFVLGTMNTADRSIANLDLAVRRRFAFVTMMPERKVIANQDISIATDVFDRLVEVFVEHAPQDALDLLPGHAYFLASDEEGVKQRFRFELLPLLEEYLREGYLGPASTDLHAVKDYIEDLVW